MADRIIRAEDNGQPLLDVDGEPFAELEVDRVDEIDEAGATVAELASRQRDWRFGHVIVDEAQDLTPMQWRMVARRAIGGSMTIVGDLAQRSIGPPETWREHLPDSIAGFSYAELTVNYRSPAEINDVAQPILETLAPDLERSKSIRSSGIPPIAVRLDHLRTDLAPFVARQRAEQPDGRLAVLGLDLPMAGEEGGVAWLSPWQAKGLEFDTVILVEPARLLDEEHGLSLLYVAITRATNRLVIAHERPLPEVLRLPS